MVSSFFSNDFTLSFSVLTNVLTAILGFNAENLIGCPKVAKTIPFFCRDANS